MLTAFQVLKQADMTEGKGGMVPVITFLDEEDAWKYTNGKAGVMGCRPSSGSWRTERYGDWRVRSIQIFESLEEAGVVERAELREKALAKLTPEERAILGLD